MGGQIWGGGVIVLVAVALWLLYLLPSWHSRHQYNAAERNAVRLNQALRVLAETSETPAEVTLELTARTAMAQQKLARRALEQKQQAELAQARLEAAQARAAHETARAQAAAEREQALRDVAAARALPAARRARARRRVRVAATVVLLLGLAGAGFGTWMLLAGAGSTLLWTGGSLAVVALFTLQRMSRVASHAAVRVMPAAVAEPEVQDVELPEAPARPTWQPRRLPQPLASSEGSRAAAVLDGAAAHAALREAALEEAKRGRAEKVAPPSIAVARAQREAAAAPAAASPFAAMGYVDDAEIEAHVRHLLSQRRAAG